MRIPLSTLRKMILAAGSAGVIAAGGCNRATGPSNPVVKSTPTKSDSTVTSGSPIGIAEIRRRSPSPLNPYCTDSTTEAVRAALGISRVGLSLGVNDVFDDVNDFDVSGFINMPAWEQILTNLPYLKEPSPPFNSIESFMQECAKRRYELQLLRERFMRGCPSCGMG